MHASRRNTTHRVLNLPLTIMGAEKRLFYSVVGLAAAAFNGLTGGGGVLLALAILVFGTWGARKITSKDPQLPRILPNTLLKKSRRGNIYDAARYAPAAIFFLEDHA